jgi:hypothetical protein
MNSNRSGWYNYFELFTSKATATDWYTYFELFTSKATVQTGTLTSNSSHPKQQHRLVHLLLTLHIQSNSTDWHTYFELSTSKATA